LARGEESGEGLIEQGGVSEDLLTPSKGQKDNNAFLMSMIYLDF
jgi:hypothetical protein